MAVRGHQLDRRVTLRRQAKEVQVCLKLEMLRDLCHKQLAALHALWASTIATGDLQHIALSGYLLRIRAYRALQIVNTKQCLIPYTNQLDFSITALAQTIHYPN